MRRAAWKFIPPGTGRRVSANTNTETGIAPEPQLYDLATDPGEKTNLADAKPELVKAMAAQLEEIRSRGFQLGL